MKPISVHLVSLGCPKNLVDSEVILGKVGAEGFIVSPDPETADVLMVNTCGFIEAAKQESIDTILSVAGLKEEGNLKGVIAVGCLAQRNGEDLSESIPELDAVFGISDYTGVPAVVRKIMNGSNQRWSATVDGGKPKGPRNDKRRMLLTPQSFAYLRISEGCDHTCTFCAIPSMRGKNRSKPIDVLIEEAESLAAAGVKELVVVAEDSTAYGLDFARKRLLHELLDKLSGVAGIEWIRVMYAYPHTVGKELTSVLAGNDKLVPYLDIPIQHISSRMLRAMKRGVSKDQVEGIMWRLRDEVPGIAVRSTFITGFPGETDEDFGELLDFVERYKFERLGVFAYSREETTPAHDMQEQVPQEVAEERRKVLMAAQRPILDAFQQGFVGKTMRVLVDGFDETASAIVARTMSDAPEVDCRVLIDRDGADGVQPGQFVEVEVRAVQDYDLLAAFGGR